MTKKMVQITGEVNFKRKMAWLADAKDSLQINQGVQKAVGLLASRVRTHQQKYRLGEVLSDVLKTKRIAGNSLLYHLLAVEQSRVILNNDPSNERAAYCLGWYAVRIAEDSPGIYAEAIADAAKRAVNEVVVLNPKLEQVAFKGALEAFRPKDPHKEGADLLVEIEMNRSLLKAEPNNENAAYELARCTMLKNQVPYAPHMSPEQISQVAQDTIKEIVGINLKLEEKAYNGVCDGLESESLQKALFLVSYHHEVLKKAVACCDKTFKAQEKCKTEAFNLGEASARLALVRGGEGLPSFEVIRQHGEAVQQLRPDLKVSFLNGACHWIGSAKNPLFLEIAAETARTLLDEGIEHAHLGLSEWEDQVPWGNDLVVREVALAKALGKGREAIVNVAADSVLETMKMRPNSKSAPQYALKGVPEDCVDQVIARVYARTLMQPLEEALRKNVASQRQRGVKLDDIKVDVKTIQALIKQASAGSGWTL